MWKLPTLTIFVFACAAALSAQMLPAGHTGDLKNSKGNVIGTVTVTGAPHGVILRVQARDLSPGWHGMHFHEKGDCSDAAFKSAGAHVHAETPVVHGFLNADANDSGDLPNIFVAANGTAEVELYSSLVTLHGSDGRPALLDKDGSALVIHADPDDYKSQPIGGAGARVACAVIR